MNTKKILPACDKKSVFLAEKHVFFLKKYKKFPKSGTYEKKRKYATKSKGTVWLPFTAVKKKYFQMVTINVVKRLSNP